MYLSCITFCQWRSMSAGFDYDRVKFQGLNVHPLPTSIFFSASCLSFPVFFLVFFWIFLFSGESHFWIFNFFKLFFQWNCKVKIKTLLNNIRIFQIFVFLFSGKRLFLPKWKILFPEKRKTCKRTLGLKNLQNVESVSSKSSIQLVLTGELSYFQELVDEFTLIK